MSGKISFLSGITHNEPLSFRPCSALGKRKTQAELDAKRQQSLAVAHERRKEELGDRYNKRPRAGQSTRGRTNAPGDSLDILTKTSNAYKAGAPMTALEDLKRQVQTVLNKMTRDKYDVLMKEHVRGQILPSVKDTKSLELMVSIIFTKAVEEAKHGFADLYANMCVELNQEVKNLMIDGQPASFVRVLVMCCQKAFSDLPTDLDPSPEEKATMDDDDLALMYMKQKNRVLGNMQFIGELFKRQLISSPVVRDVLKILILDVQKPAELYVECICKLLGTVGAKMEENQIGSEIIGSVIEKLTTLANNKVYPMRMKFMIMDLDGLRKNKWVDPRGGKGDDA